MKSALRFALLALALGCGRTEAASGGPEDYFKLATPDEKLAFLLAMPKGGLLDADLAGSVYAESYIEWAAAKRLCVTDDMTLLAPPCEKGRSAKNILADPTLYRKTIAAWSMLNSGGDRHEQFFAAPGKFGLATSGKMGAMLAEITSNAAKSRVLYLELSVTPDGGISTGLGKRLGWDGNKTNSLENLKNNGISTAVKAAEKDVQSSEAEKNRLLKCGFPDADPGCKVAIRYLYKIRGDAQPGVVFAQLATGFELASAPDSKFAGVLLTGDEADPVAMRDFSLHMQMLDFLKSSRPKVHVAIDAGELATGMVPPQGLSFHISEAVMLGHAERIGQGSDIAHENPGLAAKLAAKGILVLMCPSRSETLLGEKHFPLSIYRKSGVPVAVSSCAPGILRSEISAEFLELADSDYSDLKNMARNSLEYAFVPGKSLWASPAKPTPVTQCARDLSRKAAPSPACLGYLNANEKAKLQWQLEDQFRAFESPYQNHQAKKSSSRRKHRATSRKR